MVRFLESVARFKNEEETKGHLEKVLKWLQGRLTFALWCLNQATVVSKWSPGRVLDLCTGKACHLSSLKVLGCLHLIDESDILLLLAEDSQSIENFRAFSALIEFFHYMYEYFRRETKQTGSLAVVENWLEKLKLSPLLRLQTLEDVFSMCFLRTEDTIFEETASESEGSDDPAHPKLTRIKKNSEQYPSSNTPTGTSSGARAEKDDISLGFLCQEPSKLQVLYPYNYNFPSFGNFPIKISGGT